MSYYISRDRQQFGKYTEEDIRYGLAEGKFLGTDLAWQKGMEAWRPLDELIEPSNAPLPARVPKAVLAPYMAKPIYLKNGGAGKSISGFALVAMLMGVISLLVYGLCLKTDIAADFFDESNAFNPSMVLGYIGAFAFIMIFGHRALRQIDQSEGKLRGKGLAMSGIIMGYFLFILLTPTTVAIAVPSMNKISVPVINVEGVEKARSVSKAQTLLTACLQYASKNGGVFPENLQKLVDENYVKSNRVLIDPFSHETPKANYEYLGEGMKDSDPADAVVLRSQPKKSGRRVVARRDGSVTFSAQPAR
ncbi:hypothetical protein BH11VER1_BH11VER1_02800 [soil metagenome]